MLLNKFKLDYRLNLFNNIDCIYSVVCIIEGKTLQVLIMIMIELINSQLNLTQLN